MQTTDGGFILLAYARDQRISDYSFSKIYHVDSDGELDTLHYLGEDDINYESTNIVRNGDEGFAISSMNWVIANRHYYGYLSLFDNQGELIRLITYTDSIQDNNGAWSKGHSRFYDLVHTSDNGLVLIGNMHFRFQFNPDLHFLWIVKTDEAGEIIWDRKIQVEYSRWWENTMVWDVRELQNGDIVTFANNFHEDERGYPHSLIQVATLETDGKLIDEMVLDSLDFNHFWGITPTADNTIYCTIGLQIYKFNHNENYVPEHSDQMVNSFLLDPAFLNPFNSTAWISFTWPVKSHISLKLYNLAGREVRTLVDGDKKAGIHRKILDAANLPSGLYFVRMEAPEKVFTRKLVLIR